MLGYFRKGVEQFRSALELAPHNQSAYFGLASALLAWARYCVTVGAFGWAASLLQEASEAAKFALLWVETFHVFGNYM